ncbi:formamidopyrimidine-DNA glycosylase [Paenibacillus endophyticus]|uniref:Formamidopyrimidine-DNA glycosylase n=1 Tax=Paenibacillus endophyticus TaxID=1294268 RepID=A0A7W5GA64_9BACL|nr:DNA-formamidopyrimidine glycosylase family protein [Paenibacillus endophyticus]MBB3151647.1 formamidopyrimidine-DNA glycosylase [Paenibacillus endophyticus]
MQELPELDIYRSLLAEKFAGAQISGIEVSSSKIFQASNEQMQRDIIGKVLWFVERRGLHLLLHLDNGKRLLLHLGQGAYLYIGNQTDLPSRSAQLKLVFGEVILYGVGLRANDLQLLSVKEVEEKLGKFGPDALDKRLTLERFVARFAKKRGAIKAALMDQTVISGIGAAYSDEICYSAAIRPDAKIPMFEQESWERLYAAMHKVIKEAIANGGGGEHSISAIEHAAGNRPASFQVYDREGQPCNNCGAAIEKIDVSARKAYVCSSCQKDL